VIGAIARARRHGARLIVLAGLISALAATAAGAENAHGTPGRVTEGALLYRMDGSEALVPAPVLNTDVHMVVTGTVARARVRQEFTNPGNLWTEGIYVFPLPEDAAVDHLRMRIGERVIEGVIKERAAAKAEYEGAKRAGQRASLVEEERPNIFTTSVANIPPRAAITVEIEYQHALRYDGGQFRLRFPMVVGPRYIPGNPVTPSSDGTGWAPDTDQVPDASHIMPPVAHPARGPINPVSLVIELDPGAPPRSWSRPTTRSRRRRWPAAATASSWRAAPCRPIAISSSCGSRTPRPRRWRACSPSGRAARRSRS
jgi:hypothetical protein